ncbi:PAC2 family protein [Leucobacter weissii]|uniref:PAC2 family protein n=1 Tax=Leucobacter weissii TaxID=1983706 RepID=A0A939S6M7_9MICO|nr:PAC2 family protein [Leucobacter weissii]MBO1902544.1 PAC2 family protein [Leucobacter weissii]
MNAEDESIAHPRVLLAAFEGWSDAGAASTTALQHLGELIDAEPLHAVGADGFVDFQVHRPKVAFDRSGRRVIDWPETRLYGTVRRPGADGGESTGDEPENVHYLDGSEVSEIFLLAGVEPARDWAAFTEEIVELIDSWEVDTVILIGSLFSDAPHSRPIITTLTSEDPELRSRTGATRSDYEGPVGINTVVELALVEAQIPVLALWAQVPHYVHSAPSPKATLAILDKLEELLDVVIPRGDLLSEANEWESNIDRIAASDEDMAQYIRHLEEARDTASAPEATGEAIAHEFEKFLNIDPDEKP